MSLRFVIARSVEHRETPAALERFGAQLSHEVGEPVAVDVVGSYGELRQALADGSSEYCSVLFVRAESDLFTLADLRGATVAWVDRCSASGYVLPRMHLCAEGLRPEQLFAAERFFGSHGAAVRAVFAGDADVGATFGGPPGSVEADRRSGFANVDPTEPVRVILRSAAVPADAVVCDARLPASTRVRVTAALLHLGTFAVGRRVTRRLFGADGFVTHDPEALTALRGLVLGARARGWLPPE